MSFNADQGQKVHNRSSRKSLKHLTQSPRNKNLVQSKNKSIVSP